MTDVCGRALGCGARAARRQQVRLRCLGRAPNEPCLGRFLSLALPDMRYLGNKTRLLAFISDFLDEIGLVGGRALDAFAGTVAVGRYLRTHRTRRDRLRSHDL